MGQFISTLLCCFRDKGTPTLVLYSINRALIGEVPLGEQIMDLSVSDDSSMVATGGFGRQIRVWAADNLELLHQQGMQRGRCVCKNQL
eukprot:m.1601997 g.1601997  ORF g.1601997 m.1601997 type:complete len:88 (-) comp25353_c0_seq42:654-917(-)